MSYSLNTTFKTLKDHMAKAEQEEEDPSDLLMLRTKCQNDFGKEATRFSTLANKYSKPIFKDYELKNTFQEWKSIFKTEDKPSPSSLRYKMRKIQNVNDNDENFGCFGTSTCDKEALTSSKSLIHKEPSPSKSCTLNSTNKQESFESDDFMPSPKLSSSALPHLTDTRTHVSMNFVMLIGFMAGLLVSKLLCYVQVFLKWLLKNVTQIRAYLMGTTSVWRFLNLDESRIQITRSKLFVLPVIVICDFIYTLIDMLHFIVRVLLTAAPNNLIQLVQNFHK